MTPEEEFEEGQRAGRARARSKAMYATLAWTTGIGTFLIVFIPLLMLEDTLVRAVPILGALGRLLFLLDVGLAAGAAGVVYRVAGGKRLADIEAWERERDDF